MRKRFTANPITLVIFLAAFAAIFNNGCSVSPEIAKDCYSIDRFKRFTTPSFSPYFMNVKTENGSRIDVYIQMTFYRLRFEKYWNGFRNTYSLTYIIRHPDGEIVQTRDLDRTVETRTYDESVSNRFDGTLQSFVLDPGTYSIEIISTDNISKLRFRFIDKITARDFKSYRFAVSDELYLDTVTSDATSLSLRPIIPSALSYVSHSMGIFQEIYHVSRGDTIHVIQSYAAPIPITNKGDFDYYRPPYRTDQLKCNLTYSDKYYRNDSVIVCQKEGTMQLIQFFPSPRTGSTLLSREIIHSIDTIHSTLTMYRSKRITGAEVALDEITDAMRYIMQKDEYDSVMAGGKEKIAESVTAFWDPRGGRQRFQEFQKKISEADNLFSSCIEGSRTPMGISYIICGSPDYVDCRGPYVENWNYIIGDRSYAFQFRRSNDEDRMPIYDLVPLSVNEIVWQYFVDRWRRKK